MLAALGSHVPAHLHQVPSVPAHAHCRHDLRGRLLCLARAELQERLRADSAHLLATWAEQRGVQLKKQRAQPELLDDGPALVVTQPTARGQSLATFPSSAWLTEQVVAKSSIGGLLQGLEGWLQIALFLLHERSSSGAAWEPYMNVLPKQPEMPLFWGDAELAELQGTQLLSSVEGYRRASAGWMHACLQAAQGMSVPLACMHAFWPVCLGQRRSCRHVAEPRVQCMQELLRGQACGPRRAALCAAQGRVPSAGSQPGGFPVGRGHSALPRAPPAGWGGGRARPYCRFGRHCRLPNRSAS